MLKHIKQGHGLDEEEGRAIEKLEDEYKKIVDLQPAPPPRWVIAAGSRVGRMWGKFVDEFRARPSRRSGTRRARGACRHRRRLT